MLLFSKEYFISSFLAISSVFLLVFLFTPTQKIEAAEFIPASSTPIWAAAVNAHIYVANANSSNLTLISTTTGVMASSIAVVSTPVFTIATGSDLYVLGASVGVVDTNTSTQVATISVGSGPIWATLVGQDLYVSHNNNTSVRVINTGTRSVTHTISTAPNTTGFSILVGTDLYVVTNGGTVKVIDTVTKTVTNTITVGSSPRRAFLSGTSLYVLNSSSDTVSVINTTTKTVSTTISVGGLPWNGYLVGNDLYVFNAGSPGTISVINTSNNTVSNTITGVSIPVYGSLSGTKLYVTAQTNPGNVYVVDTATKSTIATTTVGIQPTHSILVDNKLYVLNGTSGNISVINTNTNQVLQHAGDVVLTTDAASSVTGISAVVSQTIVNVGSSTPTIRGFSYGLTTAYAYGTTTASGSFPAGTYNTTLSSSISCGFTYHYRAFVTSSSGTFYGDDATFSTPTCEAPTIVPNLATSIGKTSAVLNGEVTVRGSSTSYYHGFAWGLTSIYTATTTEFSSISTGTFSYTLTGLSCSTTYYYRPYAANHFAIGYGAGSSFTTSSCNTPTLVTNSASSITRDSVTFQGDITHQGDAVPTVRGFEYGTTGSYGSVVSESGSFPLELTYYSKFGSSGTGNGQFNVPIGIDIDSSGNLYVADANNHRVQKFDPNGNFLLSFGSAGSGNGQFSTPTSLVIDSQDNVYVVDTGNFRIQKFDQNGSYITQWVAYYVDNIAVDSSNNIYTTDQNNYEIIKYDSSGNILAASGYIYDNPPASIVVDSLGNVYFMDPGYLSVFRLNSSLVGVANFSVSGGSGNGQFSYPQNITIDSEENIFVVDTGNNRIQKVNTDFTYISKFGSSGTGDGQFQLPRDVALDSQGNAYVTDSTLNRVQKFSIPSGAYSLRLSNLECGTTYHYRSFATNRGGTSYGSDTTFTTSACPGNGAVVPSGGSFSLPNAAKPRFQIVYPDGKVTYFDSKAEFDKTVNPQLNVPVPVTPTPKPSLPTVSLSISLPVNVSNPTPVQETLLETPLTRTLQSGSRNLEVKELQILLNLLGFTVAKTGGGSPGKETDYFGPATKKALVAFQEKYADVILKPLGFKKGTGTFSTNTRKVMNSLAEMLLERTD